MSTRPFRVFVMNQPEPMGGVTWWRMYRPLQWMFRKYPDIEIVHNETGMIHYHHLQYADAALVFRPSEPAHVQAIQMARDAGVPVIADFDDDIINIPVGHPAYLPFRSKEPLIRQCVAMCAQVWVSTPAIGKVLGHPNTIVIPNAVFTWDLPDTPEGTDGPIVWRGQNIHREDLEISAFRADYARYIKSEKSFLWVGYMPTWGIVEGAAATVYYEPNQVDIRHWFSYLRAQHPKAIVKPLMPCAFNDGKSNISWLEATAAGCVLITNYAGKPGWEYALREMPRTEQAHREAWEKSREEVLKNYDLAQWCEVRYREILKTINGTS